MSALPSRISTAAVDHEPAAQPVTSSRRAFVAVVAVTLAGQLCAMVYEILVAARFGTGHEADDLALALSLIFAIANEVIIWISTLFLPLYLETRTKCGPSAAGDFLRRCVLLLLAGAGVLAGLLAIGAPAIVTLLAPALAPRGRGATLLQFFAPLLVLLPLSVLFGGALQAHRRFTLPAMRQLCWYGFALIALVTVGHRVGPVAVPFGMGVGILLFCMVLALRLRPILSAGTRGESAGPRVRRLMVSLPSLAMASGANYVSVIFERGIAARLSLGSLAGLTYAVRLLNFPLNLFLFNATAILFPALATHAAQNERDAVGVLVRQALRLAIVFTVPFALLSLALSKPLIQVLFERGAFTVESTEITATAVAYYAPGLIGIAGVQVLTRAFQALQEIGQIVRTSVVAAALNIVLMLTFTAFLGFPGLPLAISTSAIVLCLVMLVSIRTYLPNLDLMKILASASRAVIAGAVASGLAWSIGEAGGVLSTLVMSASSGVVTYIFMLCWLSREDARLAFEFVAPVLARRSAARASARSHLRRVAATSRLEKPSQRSVP